MYRHVGCTDCGWAVAAVLVMVKMIVCLKWWWGPGDGARDDCTVVG